MIISFYLIHFNVYEEPCSKKIFYAYSYLYKLVFALGVLSDFYMHHCWRETYLVTTRNRIVSRSSMTGPDVQTGVRISEHVVWPDGRKWWFPHSKAKSWRQLHTIEKIHIWKKSTKSHFSIVGKVYKWINNKFGFATFIVVYLLEFTFI